jgi:hypothetical protein
MRVAGMKIPLSRMALARTLPLKKGKRDELARKML